MPELQDRRSSSGGIAGIRSLVALARDPSGDAQRRAFLTFLVLHVVCWTLYASLSRPNLDVHADMVENFAWSRELQLGYFKHPPFFAWVVAVWFAVFPSHDWAYYLLSFLNVSLGLAGVWALIGLFDRSPRRLAACVALAVTPFMTFSAIKFNANTILLSVWPWLAYTGLRALIDDDWRAGAAAGALGAVALLSKYVSVVMLAALVATALTMPQWRRFFVSRAFAVAIIAFFVVLGPHLAWLHDAGYPTLRYVDTNKARDLWHLVSGVLNFSGAQAAWLLAGLLVLLAAIRSGVSFEDRMRQMLAADNRAVPRPVLALAIMPFVFMVLAAVTTGTRLSAPWGIPLWFAATFLLALRLDPDDRLIDAGRALAIALGVSLLAVPAAPLVRAAEYFGANSVALQPRKAAALHLSEQWRQLTGAPLRNVAGTQSYASSVTFYAPDRPSELIEFNSAHAPWMTPERLRRSGLAIVCATWDGDCLKEAQRRTTPTARRLEVTLQQDYLFMKGVPASLVMVLVPPAP